MAIVDFMKVPASGQDNYLAVEKQWKPLHQSRVESGSILAWVLYSVRGAGTESPYNFVTVTLYENFAKTETQLTENDFKKAFGTNEAEILKKTGTARNLIYSQTYQMATGIPSEVPDKYLVINSIHTNNLDKYINMEKVGYQPLHDAAKKAGLKNSWGIWTKWPNEDNAVQAVAVDGYSKFSDINNMPYDELMGKIIAGKKPGEIYDMTDQLIKTDEIRTIVKSELWDVLDTTTPKK